MPIPVVDEARPAAGVLADNRTLLSAEVGDSWVSDSGRKAWPGDPDNLCDCGGIEEGVSCCCPGVLERNRSGMPGDGSIFVEGRVFGEDLYVAVEIGILRA